MTYNARLLMNIVVVSICKCVRLDVRAALVRVEACWDLTQSCFGWMPAAWLATA